MKSEPLVSIIISNYQNIENLKTCLESIKENVSLEKTEVIVVDYGTPSLRSFVKTHFSFVKVIQLKRDVGVPAQRNIGAIISKGKYLFFLDDDTYICKNCVEKLVKTLEEDQTVAVIQPKTLILGNPLFINTTGGFMNLIGEPVLRGYLERDKNQYNSIDEVFYAQNSGFIIRRDIFRRIGMYDSSYYFYFDETDLCFRVWLHGYRVIYNPSAIIMHKVSSIRKVNPVKVYFYQRNKILTLIKNLELVHVLIYVPLAIMHSVIMGILSSIRRRNSMIFVSVDKSHLWILQNLKNIVKKRYFVQFKIRHVPDKYLLRKGVLRGLFNVEIRRRKA